MTEKSMLMLVPVCVAFGLLAGLWLSHGTPPECVWSPAARAYDCGGQ